MLRCRATCNALIPFFASTIRPTAMNHFTRDKCESWNTVPVVALNWYPQSLHSYRRREGTTTVLVSPFLFVRVRVVAFVVNLEMRSIMPHLRQHRPLGQR